MARISVRARGDRSRVSVSGCLEAADLRRLERACGPALERRDMALELRLTRVSAMDAAARAFIRRLVQRGAIVVGPGARRRPSVSLTCRNPLRES